MLLKGNKPTAIIIGAQKCGTTTLYNSLISHSNINGSMDPGNKKYFKEVDFFYSDEKWQKGLEWYLSHFMGNSGIFIDASPNYLTQTICYKRIYEFFPDIKIIICLRNPVNRAYSQYNHYRQDMPESTNWDWDHNKNFLCNLELELKAGINFENDFTGFLRKGAYIRQIATLLKFFSRSQLYISVMDRWLYNYEQELQNILVFLEQKIQPLSTLNHHLRSYTVEPFDKRAKKILQSFYEPLNRELFDYLGYEISEWRV
jgi:hypothetical protein